MHTDTVYNDVILKVPRCQSLSEGDVLKVLKVNENIAMRSKIQSIRIVQIKMFL